MHNSNGVEGEHSAATGGEARENAKKGGMQVEKAELADALAMLLHCKATTEEAKYLRTKYGVHRKRASKGVLLMARLIDLANEKGSVSAYKELITLCNAVSAEKPLLTDILRDLRGA